MRTVTAREFNHAVSAAKRAAAEGPVVITDHGRPSHVLLSIADYERLTHTPRDLVEWLALDTDFAWEPTALALELKVPEL